MSGTWSQAYIYKKIAALICKYVWDIPATSSGTVTYYFICIATTKCSWPFWDTKPVKTMYIDNNDYIALWLTMMQGQQSLTLHWRSFSRWGREVVTFSFSYIGGQYFIKDWLQPVATQITQDTRPTIVDSPSMLVFRMGQEGYRNLFFLLRRPEIHLWLSVTYWRSDSLGRKTTSYSRSIDAHFNLVYSQYLLPLIIV